MASSKASNASGKSRIAATLFSQIVPVFPFFSALQSSYPASFVWIGNFIFTLQCLGFVLNPRLPHGETLAAISPIIYSSHLPFWDPMFVDSVTYNQYIALFAIAVFLISGWIFSVIVFLASGLPVQSDTIVCIIWRKVAHLMSTILFIPMMHAFVSMMVCDQTGKTLWTLKDAPGCQGSSTSTLATLVVGIISIVLLFAFTFMAQTCLFAQDPQSDHPLSRGHIVTDCFVVCWKALSVFMFHVMLSKSYLANWLPMYIFFTGALMTMLIPATLPYFHHQVNRYFTSTYFLMTACGLAVYLSSPSGGAGRGFTEMDIDGLLVVSCTPLLWWIGQWLADFRINEELINVLPSLIDSSAPSSSPDYLVFPSGLPVYDLSIEAHRELCTEIADQPSGAGREAPSANGPPGEDAFGGDDEQLSPGILTPYLRSVLWETDVEVATRFLICMDRLAPAASLHHASVLACRIFTKGLTKYPDSSALLISLSYMLSCFTGKSSLALQLAERVNRMECSFPTRYHAFKLQTRLKLELNLRDTTYQRICDQAKKLHKETLIHMQQFWSKLLSQQVDMGQLTLLSTMITHRRDEGNRTFLTALQHRNNDRMLLTKYAGFLEQVMLEPEYAEQLRSLTKQEMEERRKNAMRGARGGAGTNHDQAVTDLLRVQANRSSAARSTSRIGSNKAITFLTTLLLFLLCGGLILFSFLTLSERLTTLRAADAAAQTRTLATQGGLLILQHMRGVGNVNDSIPRLNAIDSIAKDLLALHNQQTIGPQQGMDPTRLEFLKGPYVLSETMFTSTEHVVKPIDFWGLGYDVVQFLASFGPKLNQAVASTSATLNISLNMEIEGARLTAMHSFDRWIGMAFNASVNYCVDSFATSSDTATIALACLYCAALVVLCVVLVVVSLSVTRVTKLKQSVLSLFPMIPGDTLHRIAQQAKERVDSYDEQDQEENNGIPQLSDPSGGALSTPSKPGASPQAGRHEKTNDAEHEEPHGGKEEEQLKQRLLHKGEDHKADNGDDSDDEPIDMDQAALVVPDHHFSALVLLVLLVGGALAISITSITLHERPLKLWDTARERLEILHERQDEISAFRSVGNVYLGSGVDSDRIASLDAIQYAVHYLGSFIARHPTSTEVSLLQYTVEALTNLYQTNTRNLIVFWNAKAGTLSQYVGPLVQVADTLAATTARRGFTNPALFVQTAAALGNVASETSSVANSAIDVTTANALSIVTIVLSCCALVVSLVLLPLIFSANAFVFFSKNARLLLRASYVFLVIVVAVNAALLVEEDRVKANQSYLWNSRVQQNNSKSVFHQFQADSSSFVLTADPVAYYRYFDLVSLTQGEYGVMDMFPPYETNRTRTTMFVNASRTMRRLEKIAIRLAVAAYNISVSTRALEVSGLTWDFAAEPDAAQTRISYPQEELRYSGHDYDLNYRPWWTQALIARHTLFTARYRDLQRIALQTINDHYEDEANHFADELDFHRTVAHALHIVSAICSGIALFFVSAYTIYVLTSYIEVLQRTGRRWHESSGTQQNTASGLLRYIAILLLVLFTGIFVVGILSVTLNQRAASTVNHANSREWLVAKSLNTAEKFVSGGYNSISLAQNVIRQVARDLFSVREALYFSTSAATGLNLPGVDDKQDELLFGTSVTLPADYQCGYTQTGSTSDAEVFVKGASAAYAAWEQHVHLLSTTSNVTEALLAIQEMRLSFSPVMRAMRASSNMFLTYMETRLSMFNTIFVVIAAVTAVCTVFMFFWVIQPLLQQQVAEESGSKLLLRLIPQDVCDSVPAITEFFDAELSGEAGNGGATGSSSGDNKDITTIPVIAIDSRGVVLKFNSASEAIFGYTAAEVIGNNVSILMPEKIGKSHDGYLASYRRTGIRRVIGFDRQVHARRKGGDLFPIELNVKEFKRDNGEFVYIGFVKDITKNLELKGTEELNNLIQEYATVPMIAIDSLGTVLRFNRAAEECFGQSAADVVNQNIKMLMPEEIAARHDSYLAAYLRTREKHVIDTTRRVHGLRKSGEIFPLELNVKEITTSDFGAMSTYLGFCRDLTHDNVLDEANRINDEITDLSPVPIIGIDPYGKVLKFSRAAVEVLGYEQVEVLDRNVKMIMPEAIAEQHDSYLENYRNTGKKKIVGTERELIAQRKDGTQIPVLALIREVKKEGSHMGTFVGYLLSLNEEKNNAHFKAVDDVIVEMHPVPLLTMNSSGIVNRVNKALLLEFGYRREEVIEKNVKMLMPNEIAVKHDGYLKRYLETKIPHIIGSSRRVQGKRKNGTVFPIEVKVEEVVDADGKGSYIGFLRNMGSDLNVEQQFAINTTIMEISPTPMIGIDPYGTVKIFSRAAEGVWKRKAADMIGTNVKVLMPQYLADQHDFFLERYRTTRVKHIIDEVRVLEAIDSAGRTFPAEISIREIKREGAENFYIAYCRDMMRDGETQCIVHRNAQISDLSPMPLLQIDLYGIVQQFNCAAEREFGWNRADIIGRNVKLIIPDDIAKNHDAYLAQYRKTRVKSVIGSLRRTRAKRKDGTSFAVEISVNEVVVEGDPERNSYIGYVRNITEELRLIKANEVSGVISDLSPNPLVAITKKGVVITFNRAACNAFRYADASQILNQNVKMLMPDEIAVQHDGYLIAYSKTGQKHVVDTTRSVRAKRSDGTTFPAEISVREIKKQGKESTFLSYIRDCTNEVQMAQATQVSDAIQTLSSIPMIIIDVIGTIKQVNHATYELFGYSRESESLIGKNVKTLMPSDIAARHDGFLSKYLRTGVKTVIDSTRQVTAKKADGSTFAAEISVREIKTDDGDVIYIAYLRDLTHQQQVAAARAVNEAIGESSVIPLIVIDQKGTVKMFVPAAEQFFGYTAAEVLGQNVKMLMPEEIAVNHDGYLSKYLKTGIKNVIDNTRSVQARLKSGDTVPVEITVKEAPSKTGEGTNYIGYVMDVRDQYAVAKALAIADSVRDMMTVSIISITEEGTIRQFNRAAEDFFGYSREEVLGKNIKMLMPPDFARNHDRYLDTYRRTRVKHVIGSSRLVQGLHKNGDTLEVELNVSEFFLDGRPNFIAYATDRQKELELVRSSKVNEALVSLSTVPIIAIDSRNRIARFSSSAEQEFGWKATEVIGQNINILMEDNVAVKHDSFVHRYRETGHTYRSPVVDQKIDVVAKRRDGSTFPAELTVKEIKKVGQMSSFVGYIRDISDDLILRSNAILCEALEQLLPDPLIVINQTGVIQSFTPPAAELFGYSKEEVLGKNVKMLMPEEIAGNHDEYLHRYMTTGVKHVVDTTRKVVGQKKNGGSIEVELRIRELNSKTKERYFIGYVRDCSRDYELAVETEVGEALIEHNPDAIITITPNGTIQKFNHQAERLFQFERKQIIGRNVKVLMPEETAIRHDQYLSNYRKTGVKRVVDATRHVTAERKTGETFPAEISVKEVKDENGQAAFFIGYVRQI